MRTTVDIPESLLQTAKDAAEARKTTLSAIVGDALRGMLASASTPAVKPFHLHTVRGRRVQPGMDLDRTSALLVAEDESVFGGGR
ncbi:MAG: hypothetical protein M3N93_05590 [Acidobacteriota bacterium]|nr:hypothetical protein [Acidobacteriota bacterium]